MTNISFIETSGQHSSLLPTTRALLRHLLSHPSVDHTRSYSIKTNSLFSLCQFKTAKCWPSRHHFSLAAYCLGLALGSGTGVLQEQHINLLPLLNGTRNVIKIVKALVRVKLQAPLLTLSLKVQVKIFIQERRLDRHHRSGRAPPCPEPSCSTQVSYVSSLGKPLSYFRKKIPDSLKQARRTRIARKKPPEIRRTRRTRTGPTSSRRPTTWSPKKRSTCPGAASTSDMSCRGATSTKVAEGADVAST